MTLPAGGCSKADVIFLKHEALCYVNKQMKLQKGCRKEAVSILKLVTCCCSQSNIGQFEERW